MNKHDWILRTLAVNLLWIPLGCGSARIGPQAGAADRVRQINTLKAAIYPESKTDSRPESSNK